VIKFHAGDAICEAMTVAWECDACKNAVLVGYVVVVGLVVRV